MKTTLEVVNVTVGKNNEGYETWSIALRSTEHQIDWIDYKLTFNARGHSQARIVFEALLGNLTKLADKDIRPFHLVRRQCIADIREAANPIEFHTVEAYNLRSK